MIYEGLVICHPKEHCSTWDFCTHYIPHNKGLACSCDSCVPCDIKTVLEHRKKIRDADRAALLKWLDEPCKEHPDVASERLREPTYYNHRKDCPQCMKELRGEK
jgi:hypothetical protein